MVNKVGDEKTHTAVREWGDLHSTAAGGTQEQNTAILHGASVHIDYCINLKVLFCENACKATQIKINQFARS